MKPWLVTVRLTAPFLKTISFELGSISREDAFTPDDFYKEGQPCERK